MFYWRGARSRGARREARPERHKEQRRRPPTPASAPGSGSRPTAPAPGPVTAALTPLLLLLLATRGATVAMPPAPPRVSATASEAYPEGSRLPASLTARPLRGSSARIGGRPRAPCARPEGPRGESRGLRAVVVPVRRRCLRSRGVLWGNSFVSRGVTGVSRGPVPPARSRHLGGASRSLAASSRGGLAGVSVRHASLVLSVSRGAGGGVPCLTQCHGVCHAVYRGVDSDSGGHASPWGPAAPCPS
ncbi:unnamed protein product [Lampetra planeri]